MEKEEDELPEYLDIDKVIATFERMYKEGVIKRWQRDKAVSQVLAIKEMQEDMV
jgi:hypothetical protein